MTDCSSPILRRIARVAALAFALFVLGWLVLLAQRNADHGAAAPVPSREDAPSPEERLLRDPLVGPIEEIKVPTDGQTFLFSSKSGRPLVPAAPPTWPPATGLLPSSKSGAPLLPRSPQDQRQ